MKIIVVGCGKTGKAIIENLVEEGHDLIAVDSNAKAIEEVTTEFDVMCVMGNGADVDTLKEAGADNCKLVVAATSSDETNMLCCFLARKLGAGHTIARIRNPEYNDNGLGFLCQQLDLSESINPDRLAANEICNILKFPSAVNIESFSGKFELLELVLKEDSPLAGNSLIDLRQKYHEDFLVCAVQREGKTVIPSGRFKLDKGDRIALTASPSEAQKLLKEMGILEKSARSVMIVGAGKISHYLAKFLLSAGISVKIIEIDREHCIKFAEELNDPKAMIINGDGARQEILLEEGIDSKDAFVALTGSDEENILISIYAASRGVKKVITKINRPELAAMAEKLGLECIISPNKLVSGRLSRYARALSNTEGSNLAALYRVLDGSAEAVEFKVNADFRYLGIHLREMTLKKNILIAGIIRGRKIIVPSGNDLIMNGDKVILLSSGHKLSDLSDIMEDA